MHVDLNWKLWAEHLLSLTWEAGHLVSFYFFVYHLCFKMFLRRSFKCTQKGNTAVSLFETVLESGVFLLVSG